MTLLRSLNEIPADDKIVVYGSGSGAVLFVDLIRRRRPDVSILYFLDSFKDGEFMGFPLRKFDGEKCIKETVVVCSNSYLEIMKGLDAASIHYKIFDVDNIADYSKEALANIADSIVSLDADLRFYLIESLERTCRTVVQSSFGSFKMACPSPTTYWLARNFDHESHTMHWIASFEDQSVFFDIGANVGVMSLLAAAKGCTVYAFEPFIENIRLLDTNIRLNNFGELIIPCPVALCATDSISTLFLSSTEGGSARHSFNKLEKSDYRCRPVVQTQFALGMKLDTFFHVASLPSPNYIKIDVDGNEDLILAGGENTFANDALKEVQIELDTERNNYSIDIYQYMQTRGFKVKFKYEHQDSPIIDVLFARQ